MDLLHHHTMQNTIILGDFNIHVNDSMDVNADIFQDTMAATGLFQWVDFPDSQTW